MVTKTLHLRRNPSGVVFLHGPPDQTGGLGLVLRRFLQTFSTVRVLQHITLPTSVRRTHGAHKIYREN